VAAGYTHLNLDGTVIRTDRVAAPGPNKADLWWSGKHKHHGGNVQVISAPDGWPLWVAPELPHPPLADPVGMYAANCPAQ